MSALHPAAAVACGMRSSLPLLLLVVTPLQLRHAREYVPSSEPRSTRETAGVPDESRRAKSRTRRAKAHPPRKFATNFWQRRQQGQMQSLELQKTTGLCTARKMLRVALAGALACAATAAPVAKWHVVNVSPA